MEKQDAIINAHIACERAIDELRRQMGIIVQHDNKQTAAFPVEYIVEALLAGFRSPAANCKLLITATRARSIGLDPSDASAIVTDAGNLTLAQIMALADPLADQKELPKVTFTPASTAMQMMLKLAKFASNLPAMLLIEGDAMPDSWLKISDSDMELYIREPLIDIVPTAVASLPLLGAETTTIRSFRACYGTAVHLALMIGTIAPGASPLVRIHSSCVTGDILGSLRCDCGDQLKLALSEIGKAGGGILIYLHQEGRGIGITNKLRAYRLQEQGFDTYEANLLLGFEEDERDFSIAAAILKKLGHKRIRLLTNNPLKITALEQSGISITERVPLIVETGRHNHAYLEPKSKKAGHLF